MPNNVPSSSEARIRSWLWVTAAALAGAFLLPVVLGGWAIAELLGSADELGDELAEDLAETIATAYPTLFPGTPTPVPTAVPSPAP